MKAYARGLPEFVITPPANDLRECGHVGRLPVAVVAVTL
jgi:hypothetical protein